MEQIVSAQSSFRLSNVIIFPLLSHELLPSNTPEINAQRIDSSEQRILFAKR